MIQSHLDRAVARATGEAVSTIRRRGFSIADPARVLHDPEPASPPHIIDWDEQDANRVSYFPQRRQAVA
jgi:hypothetical protein